MRLFFLLTFFLLAAASTAIAVDTCSEGTGVPPFLSSGAYPNLLMMIDNSGSMLDLAYLDDDGVTVTVSKQAAGNTPAEYTCTVDPVDAPNPTACMDESFLVNPNSTTCGAAGVINTVIDPDKLYAGYFDRDSYYGWVEASLPSQAAGDTITIIEFSDVTCYDPAADPAPLVMNNNVLYTAGCTVPNCYTANGNTVLDALGTPFDGCVPSAVNLTEDDQDDIGTFWSPYFDFTKWLPGRTWIADTFSIFENKLFYTAAGGDDSASGAISPTDPASATTWTAVDHTWLPGYSYDSGTIVTYNGMLFYNSTSSTFTSSDTGLFNDIATVAGADTFPWSRIGDSYFQEEATIAEVLGGTAALPCGVNPSFTSTHTDAAGNTITDMQITMLNMGGNVVTSQDIVDARQLLQDINTELALNNPDLAKVQALTDQRNALLPYSTRCFAATGNFLNWLAASKFDIQKGILTGGKLYKGLETCDPTTIDPTAYANDALYYAAMESCLTGANGNDADDRLIMENRGCAGADFVKQLTVDAANDIKMTLRVRGSSEGDWLGTNDDTTRIDIFAVTVGGYDDTQCREAVELMENDGSLPDIRAALEQCMYADNPPTDLHEAKTKQIYFAAVHNCVKGNWNKGGELGTFCKDLYLGEQDFNQTYPWEISSWDPEYICYGEYTSPTYPYTDGEGYIGRLWREWQPAPGAGETCLNACDCTDARWTASVGYCIDAIDNKTEIRCGNDTMKYCTKHGNTWTCVPYYEDTVTNLECVPGAGTIPNFCDDIVDNPVRDAQCWVPENQPSDITWETALRDYCGDLAVPEVIDPSDVVSTSTTNSGNIPASLIDSGIYDRLGQGQAIFTMKGYIKWTIPEVQIGEMTDTLTRERPIGPRGVFFDEAENVRLGIMAFKDNGSKTECELLEATCSAKTNDIFDVCINGNPAEDATKCDYCEARMSIEKFCPETNGDGARVIANIELAQYRDNMGTNENPADDVENWNHYKLIADGINATRATAWTPLAEAVYTAIGYYGQNTAQRLSPNVERPDEYDFFTAGEMLVYDGSGATTYVPGDIVEYPAGTGVYYQTSVGGVAKSATGPSQDTNVYWSKISALDPIDHWCQDNHLLIITEGASTADINQQVIDFVTASQAANDNQDPGHPLGSDTDTTVDSACTDGLDGSTYLDDITDIARRADPSYLFTSGLIDGINKRNPFTHIVTTGSLRDDGTGECSPKTIMENAATNGGSTLYTGEDPDSLEENLKRVFANIISRASAGSAASVISSSRSGSGAVYQAIFWPDLVDTATQASIQWVGDVHSLFIDKNSFIYEDTDQNGKLEPSGDFNNDGDLDDAGDINSMTGPDRRILFFFSDTANRTRACLNITDYFANNLTCPEDPALIDCTGAGCLELQDINYIWSAGKWLANANDATITSNRSDYISNSDMRYIYTWEDLNNDGIVDHNSEWLPFTADDLVPALPLDVTPAAGYPVRGAVVDDFAFESQFEANKFAASAALPPYEDATKAVIDWVRGRDQLNDETADDNGNFRLDKRLRVRQFPLSPGVQKTWRLGDVIHSTPTVVGRPAESYHFIYKDPTYSLFAKRYANRRQMIYYGANDGMLHAVNGGFYSERDKMFCLVPLQSDGSCDETTLPANGAPDRGAEMWAYIPYNLIPHLKCMADEQYDHKYYVDQRPRIFDAQIFQDDCTWDALNNIHDCSNAVHPGGWGTILVGSMRFGGAPINAADTNSVVGENRKFTSAFFVFDISNPEEPPVLLGEMTTNTDTDTIATNLAAPDDTITTSLYADMGYTTSSPTMVVMREDTGETNWYLIMGSGPNTIKGENKNPGQRGKIAILPLAWLLGDATNWGAVTGSLVSPKNIDTNARKAFRIPSRQPGTAGHQSGTQGGTYWVPGADNSFISDLITVDFDVETSGQFGLGGLYRSDAVYFGTIDGDSFSTGAGGATYWNGGGRMYRMVTKELSGGVEVASEPDDWNDKGGQYNDGTLTRNWYSPHYLLIDAKMPVTTAASVGWDSKTFWVYFGTGRFYDKLDKTDDQINRFFGIRETFDLTSGLTCNDHRLSWETMNWDVDTNVLNDQDSTLDPGDRGLLQVDDIIVSEFAASRFEVPYLKCSHCVEDTSSIDGYSCTDLPDASCFPNDMPYISATDNSVDPPVTDTTTYRFEDLRKYIAGNNCDSGIDGWFREFHEDRERNLGQAALLGGLLTYTGYVPHDDICKAEGRSFLYGVHYQTGTAWYENVFGTFDNNGNRFVKDKLSLGRGLATRPSLHVGSGENDATAFVQTSTGEIIEIGQENLPLSNTKSGRTGWLDE